MFAEPDGLAGALPEARGEPEDNQELREHESGAREIGRQVFDPKVQTQTDDNPSDHADTKIKPKK